MDLRIRYPALIVLAGFVACFACRKGTDLTIESPVDGAERQLILRDKVVSDDDLRRIVGQRTTLEVLEIYHCVFTGEMLAGIGNLPNLRQLRLEDFAANDNDLLSISRLEKLEVLNLPSAEFTDEGLQHLADMPNLSLLRFGSPAVTDAGMQLIAEMPKLRFLHLLHVPISDAGLDSLHGKFQLESFYLDGGNVSEQGLSRLIKALPDLHFHRDQMHVLEDPRSGHAE